MIGDGDNHVYHDNYEDGSVTKRQPLRLLTQRGLKGKAQSRALLTRLQWIITRVSSVVTLFTDPTDNWMNG